MMEFDPNNLPEDASYIEGPDPEFDENFYRQDSGGIIDSHNGLADKLLQNNDLYRSMKGDWSRSDWNGNHNIKTTTGRQDGKFYITREQMNVKQIALDCQAYRKAAEAGIPDPLAPIMEDGKLGWKWMDLPKVISVKISDEYFGGMPWNVIKRDRTLKAQFYKVVEREYNVFVCYPHGKLPIPIDVPYPTKVGSTRFFKGM